MSNPTNTELTFDEAAQFFQVSPRQVRTILAAHADLCPARRYGHRTVRFAWSDLQRVAEFRKRSALGIAARASRKLLPRGKVTR